MKALVSEKMLEMVGEELKQSLRRLVDQESEWDVEVEGGV